MNTIKKIFEYLKKHKGLFLLLILFLMFLIIMLVIVFSFIKEKSTSKYGTRLEGIAEVQITNKQMNNYEKKIKENSEVEKVSIRIQGKIVYINIKYNNSTSIDKAKAIAVSSLDNFSDKEIKYYDICYFLTQIDDKNDDTKEFAITGTKQPKLEEISWIKS